MAVLVGVMLARFFGMRRGVDKMAVCDMRVVAGFFMITGFVVFGGRAMVPRGMFMVLSSFTVVLSGFVGHG